MLTTEQTSQLLRRIKEIEGTTYGGLHLSKEECFSCDLKNAHLNMILNLINDLRKWVEQQC